MRPLGDSKVWMVEVALEETPEGHTEARAVLPVGAREYGGWGRAQRNPSDASMPLVGEELAVARALSDLAHHLLDSAAHAIELREGGRVHVHG